MESKTSAVRCGTSEVNVDSKPVVMDRVGLRWSIISECITSWKETSIIELLLASRQNNNDSNTTTSEERIGHSDVVTGAQEAAELHALSLS